MHTRTADWRQRLTDYLAAQALARPVDCALWAAGAVEAMTGFDPAAAFRGRYTTLRGGLRVLRSAGFDDHIALIRHHFPEVDRHQARPGDIAVIDGPSPQALGIVQGPAGVYVLTTGGIGTVPIEAAQVYFGV